MKRIQITERPNKAKALEEIGLSFHGWDGYWKEDACYEFNAAQVEVLETATNQLNQMCYKAVQYVIDFDLLGKFGIPEDFWPAVIKSWEDDDFTLYGRFDFSYDGINPPKLLEYNADTPTSLLESSVAQWYWLEQKANDIGKHTDQFNSIHEKLVDQWKYFVSDKFAVGQFGQKTIHFASVAGNEEDWVCTHYLMETAVQAGFQVVHIHVEDLGYDHDRGIFVDLDNEPIRALFKLYPWEWLMHEEFGKYIATSGTHFIEPMWKSILSNKAILPILWKLFPNHANLLPAFYEADPLGLSYVKKPLLSREGANVTVVELGMTINYGEGEYGEEGYVYQGLAKLPTFDKRHAVVGSWVVGDESAGICIRESDGLVTTNMSNFVPHYFVE